MKFIKSFVLFETPNFANPLAKVDIVPRTKLIYQLRLLSENRVNTFFIKKNNFFLNL